MFRRRWSGLPEDPTFPSDLKGLGYFVNDVDEIRSIDDPKFYFKFFLTKNQRTNDRQRFAFNYAVEKLVRTRLEALGLTTVPLPLGADPSTDPHVPILASADLLAKKRVVIVFGDSQQDLGILAHRVCDGPGGVNKGSMVGFVSELFRIAHEDKNKSSSKNKRREEKKEDRQPGVVLANTGQTWWWPEGGRPLCSRMSCAVDMASAVHEGRSYDARTNAVPGSQSAEDHVRTVFESIVPALVDEGAKIDVVAVGDAADMVEAFLDGVWEESKGGWAKRMNCLALLGGYYDVQNVKSEGFKEFLAHRTRVWIVHQDPLNTAVSGPYGNPRSPYFTNYGAPVLSGGESQIEEQLLIAAQTAVLNFLAEVDLAGDEYRNPHFMVVSAGEGFNQLRYWTPDEVEELNAKEVQP